MEIFYLGVVFCLKLLNQNIYFRLAICKKIVFYSIENVYMEIYNKKKIEEISYEFKIESNDILKNFKSVYLLDNQYLKCKLQNGDVKYFIPNTVEISDSTDIILNFSVIEDYQANESTQNIFLGLLTNEFLFRFKKYATTEDIFVNTIYSYEFIGIMRVLEICGFQKTKNNDIFLKYLLIKSIMSADFDFKNSEIFLHTRENNQKSLDSVMKHLFSMFIKFVFSEGITNREFFFFNSAIMINKHRIILSYPLYIFCKEKFSKKNIFTVSFNTISYLEKILNSAWSTNCICFFIRYIKIDFFCFDKIKYKNSQKFPTLIKIIKPRSLQKLSIVDNFGEKMILRMFIDFGYFDICESVKIVSDLNIEEIDMVLKNCTNLKRLVIVVEEAYYNIISELYEFALKNQSVCINYKCTFFKMECQKDFLLRTFPKNLIFYVAKYNISFKHCSSCHILSLSLFRKLRIYYESDKYLLFVKTCIDYGLNSKNISFYRSTKKSKAKIHSNLLKSFTRLHKLESMSFDNIIVSKSLIRFILVSNQLKNIAFNNVKISSKKFSKYKIYNFVLQGFTIRKSNFIFNVDFLEFISLFPNITFLKIHIENIDGNLKSAMAKYASKRSKKGITSLISSLEYLKITISEYIVREFPVLFALSLLFDFKKLNILILKFYDFEEQDIQCISNITSITDIYIKFYKRYSALNLNRLITFIKNNEIESIRLDFFDLNKNFIEFLHLLRHIKFISITFSYIVKTNSNLLKKIKFKHPFAMNIFCRDNRFVSYEESNYFKECNIRFRDTTYFV
ncbi:hypothetical protein CWI36_0394p0030 [Hamiltosporidium magnivora]|uniref:Uncharacterized protein n=1 Tax=Hamiltosporidium magnivora TaxID=148818 RepID=A0A4Q9LFI2_9MICR|nr:hypothetical protein CWI36_0394p0030 [Hamiltosporidium magnivora]